MEQDIKNFDRTIEQAMNEQQVAPPFGMWNRISADLDAMPMATAPTVAPTSALPKRAFVGFIAAALLIGVTAVTAYMVNSTKVNSAVATPTAVKANETTVPAKVIATPVEQPKAEVKPITAKVAPVLTASAKKNNVVAELPKNTDVPAGAVDNTAAPAVEPSVVVNANQDVPTPVTKGNDEANSIGENQTYYFPPVDNMSDSKTSVDKSAKKNTATAKTDDDDDDKKSKVFGSSEQKVKFHPPKRKKFSYGKIVRMR